MSYKRKKMGKKQSRRHFTKHASHVHKKNVRGPTRIPMRGGIRL